VNLLDRLAAIQERGGRAVLFTVVEGEDAGAKFLVEEGETGVELAEQAHEVIRGARNTLLELGDRKVFGEVYMPPPRLFVHGAVDTAEALCRAVRLVGWTSVVADARARFATPERLPSADELVVKWPEEAFAQLGLDRDDAIVVLTHDEKFDQPALKGALESAAFYIGALGSRRTQSKRLEKLAEAGVPETSFDRILGPCGLDIGAESPAETALSILAEIMAVRAGRAGGSLRDSKAAIHAPAAQPA
jgi:xanthine dehydrogenase accessory factor